MRFENRLAEPLLHDLVCYVRVEGRVDENGVDKTGCWHICRFTIHLAGVVHQTSLLREREREMAEQVRAEFFPVFVDSNLMSTYHCIAADFDRHDRRVGF